jgi:hypothetical protein
MLWAHGPRTRHSLPDVIVTKSVKKMHSAHIHTPTAEMTMAMSPVLAFIDSRTKQALRKAKTRCLNNDEKGKKLRFARRAVLPKTRIGSYIYAIIVDGVVRLSAKAGTDGCTLI